MVNVLLQYVEGNKKLRSFLNKNQTSTTTPNPPQGPKPSFRPNQSNLIEDNEYYSPSRELKNYFGLKVI